MRGSPHIGGGTAAAAVVITDNSQVAPGTIAGHAPSRSYHSNIISSSVNGEDLAASSVSGSEIKTGPVNGSDVLDGSINQLDITGADKSGTMQTGNVPPLISAAQVISTSPVRRWATSC